MFFLRSGIPSLDRMFRPSGVLPSKPSQERAERGIVLADRASITSVCIAGPDGTGKSVLAMHFASRYAADSHQIVGRDDTQPLVFYVSTDLSFTTANQMWMNFGLDRPNTRRVPHCYPQLEHETQSPKWLGGRAWDVGYELPLVASQPDDMGDLARYLAEGGPRRQIAYLDLASHATGDDWGLIERLLAMMPDAGAAPRHLLIVDAMEGMETFAGELDAFGQKVARRGRIAKLMRLARKKCHLIVVSEEPREGTRLPEQFVANVVLRLRTTESQGYSRRSLEIEKARGQSHVRGRHPYVIRDGRGSTTGMRMNFDDPVVVYRDKCQSYIDIFPSLHVLAREIMEKRGTGREPLSGKVAGFGIPELDEMLAARGPLKDKAPRLHGDDDRGLPSGAVSALIGDANTQKSFLAVAFLGHVFHEIAWQVIADPIRGRTFRRPTRQQWAARLNGSHLDSAGAAVLVTTKDENSSTIVRRFYQQLHDEMLVRVQREGFGDRVERIDRIWKDDRFASTFIEWLTSRTVVRRLEIHDTPSPVLFQIIRRSVESAQQIVRYGFSDVCLGGVIPDDAPARATFGFRIRVVIDDFNSLMRTYGKAQGDPLFLPFLLLSLRREGLSTLVVETQSGTHGMPALVIGEDAQSDLRALSDYRLYTWHVPDFFGDHRIAIAAIPPMVKQDRKSPVLVRELQWYPPNSASPPKVNPEFELYAGLETGRPALVPLQVHLYAETPAWEAYIKHLDQLWRRVFDPPTPPSEQVRRSVVTAEKSDNYELLRELCDLHANTSLDYSLILQIDEFWHHHDSFRSQADYLEATIDSPYNKGVSRFEKRRSWFNELPPPVESVSLDRVPFIWDFGFLAFRERLWNEATLDSPGAPDEKSQGKRQKPPPEEFADLKEKRREIQRIWDDLRQGAPCTWRAVLEAAWYVARWESARQPRPVPAFDLAMVAPETFSCLVLELWFSEIYDTKLRRSPQEAEAFADTLHTRDWTASSANKIDLAVLALEYWSELYRSWLLLVEVLDLSAFTPRHEGFGFGFGRKADSNAVVVRHWYKSASHLRDEAEGVGPVRFCRLPGSFAVRGDWYLATVRGSRSDRLADRAVDLLSTPAANTDRLMRGLGLPTHQIRSDAGTLSTRLWGWHSGDPDPRTLTYAEVLALGATDDDDFRWLWRSNLKEYYAVAPVWERWLYRILRRWKSLREFVGTKWVSGFELYDTIKRLETGVATREDRAVVKKVVSRRDFWKLCNVLVSELRNASN